jgi:hypothetical protein
MIIALLPEYSRSTLISAVGPGRPILSCASCDAFQRALDQYPLCVVVFDHSMIRESHYQTLLEQMSTRLSGVLHYTTLTTTSAKRIIQAAHVGLSEIALRDPCEDPAALHGRLVDLLIGTAPALVLEQIASRVTLLSDHLRREIVSLFAGGSIPESVGSLSVKCGIGRRSLEREIRNAALMGGAASVLGCSRAARAWSALCIPGASVIDVARAAGYSSSRVMRAQLYQLVNLSPMAIPRSMELGAFASQLVWRMTTARSRDGARN